MGSASSTYRPKCIYLDIDGRIQKVLLLFFTQPRLRAVLARPIPQRIPGLRIPAGGERGGSCLPSAWYTAVCSQGKGRLAEGRAGRCQRCVAASSPCRWGCSVSQPRLPCLQSLAWGEFSPAGSRSRECSPAPWRPLGPGCVLAVGIAPGRAKVPGSRCGAAAPPVPQRTPLIKTFTALCLSTVGSAGRNVSWLKGRARTLPSWQPTAFKHKQCRRLSASLFSPPSLCQQFFGRKPSAFSVTEGCCQAPSKL